MHSFKVVVVGVGVSSTLLLHIKILSFYFLQSNSIQFNYLLLRIELSNTKKNKIAYNYYIYI